MHSPYFKGRHLDVYPGKGVNWISIQVKELKQKENSITKTLNLSVQSTKRQLLRKNQTKAEKIMWSWLRNKRLAGYRFCRQFGINTYIVDFYCPEVRLAIELDGSSHRGINKKAYDHQRTNALLEQKITVMRFFNSEVEYQTAQVCQQIINKIKVLQRTNSLSLKRDLP